MQPAESRETHHSGPDRGSEGQVDILQRRRGLHHGIQATHADLHTKGDYHSYRDASGACYMPSPSPQRLQ